MKESLIGLAILAAVALESIILSRRKTTPVILCDQLFAGFVVYKIFGEITVIYTIALIVFLLFIKYKNHINEDVADYDYTDRIFSISAIFNLLHKPKEMVMGRILPVNHNEIKYNMKAIELDDVVLSGQTLITGSSGSGKNLHKNTMIPTINGMKKLKDIQINDKIFDKNGKPTTVIDKYSPEETKFYRFTLSDGTTIDAGGGHLWEVLVLNQRLCRSRVEANITNIDLDKMKNCSSNNYISRKAFIKKYLKDNNYWNIFIYNNCSELFNVLDKNTRYIDSNKILDYTYTKLSKPSATKQALIDRISRIKHFQESTGQIYMTNIEAANILLSKWKYICKAVNIKVLDFLYAYGNEKDACKKVYERLNQLNIFDNADSDKRPTKIMSSNEIAEYLKQHKSKSPVLAIRRPIACEYASVNLPIKPYWFGAWLGDGSKWEACIGNTDVEMQNRLIQDYPCRKITQSIPRKTGYKSITTWYFNASVRRLLTANNLRGNKHIPEIYKIASIEDKLDLLAGIIDTDGSVGQNGDCSIGLINKQVIETLREICCSLGFRCTPIVSEIPKLKKDNGEIVKCHKFWSFYFYPTIMIPLQVPRKRDNLQNKLNKIKNNEVTQQVKHNRFYIKSIEEISGNSDDYFCLAVDSPTHMFLCTESYVPTHNTTTMKTIIKQRMDTGRPIVFFDYKGEEEILDEIKEFADSVGMPYYEFSARACTFKYDPFLNLDETGKVEALMNTRRWSSDGADEHYKTSMQLAIQNLVRAYDTYRADTKETTNYICGLYEYAKSYHPQSNERDGFNNLIKSLEILISSKAKEMLGDDPDFTFEREDTFIICFSFTSANKALANSISSFVYTDIMDRGTRKHYKDKLLLCIDEFGTLESSTIIKDLLEKGRSGGVQTVFSILDINQVAMTSGEFFVNSILGTINSYLIHAGATQSTAEMLAGVQKYDKDFDIMSLRKPYKGRKPTAMFITKYGIINKKSNQEVFRMIPYTKVLKKVKSKITNTESISEANFDIELETKPEVINHYVIPIEELDLSQPIDNIEDYL